LIGDFFDFIGFGILSPMRRSCKELLSKLNNFKRKMVVGIAPGQFKDPKEALRITIDCIKFLKRNLELPILAGCSSPIITNETSKFADGVLFNYVKPEFLNWILRFAKRKLFFAAYGPSLILPSEFFEDLLIASAIVISSKSFVKKFGFEDLFEKINTINFQKLVKRRQEGKSIKNLPEYKILESNSETLLENFTISGDFKNVIKRIKSLLNCCDHVILSDPFFRDDNAMKHLGKIVKSVECKKYL